MLAHEDNQFAGDGGMEFVADLQLIEPFEIGSGGEGVSALVGGDQRHFAGGGVNGGYGDGYPVAFEPGSPGHALAINTRSVGFVIRRGCAGNEEQQRGSRNSRKHNLEWA